MFCAACRAMRPPEELLAFWPVRAPERVRYVCRPSMQRPEMPGCFRELVGAVSTHRIALATAFRAAAA